MRITNKINRYTCITDDGILKKREYVLNGVLKEYMQGKCGILRALLMGLYGASNIKSYGVYIDYFVRNKYKFVEKVYMKYWDFSKLIVIVTTKSKFSSIEKMKLNTTLIKLLTNQVIKFNKEDLTLEDGLHIIEIFISDKNTKETINDNNIKIKSFLEDREKNNSLDKYEVFDKNYEFDLCEEFKNRIMEKNLLDDFMEDCLSVFPDLLEFFKSSNQDDNIEKILECCDEVLKCNGVSNYSIKKKKL